MAGLRRAVFLDRDGVIIEDVDFLTRKEDMRLVPGAAAALRRLAAAGLRVIVVTNQSGVARGYLSLGALEGIHRELRRRLLERGAAVHAIYFCPHHPRVGARVRCECRKPRPGMLERARRRFGLDMARSFMVGDRVLDVETARNAGCAAVLVRTGKGGRDRQGGPRPDAVCRDIGGAATWILRRVRHGE